MEPGKQAKRFNVKNARTAVVVMWTMEETVAQRSDTAVVERKRLARSLKLKWMTI
jgi:hypothetical protein